MKKILIASITAMLALSGVVPQQSHAQTTIADRLSGRILLQVESHGEAWYVNPADKKRHYLGRPHDAFQVMSELGIGVSNINLSRIEIGLSNINGTTDTDGDGLSDVFERAIHTNELKQDSDGDGYLDLEELENGYSPIGPSKLPIDKEFTMRQAGRILLAVENNGEAWYVSPTDLKRHFLGRPSDAFRVMRSQGLGISEKDISEIVLGENIKVDADGTSQEPSEVIIFIRENNMSATVAHGKRKFIPVPQPIDLHSELVIATRDSIPSESEYCSVAGDMIGCNYNPQEIKQDQSSRIDKVDSYINGLSENIAQLHAGFATEWGGYASMPIKELGQIDYPGTDRARALITMDGQDITPILTLRIYAKRGEKYIAIQQAINAMNCSATHNTWCELYTEMVKNINDCLIESDNIACIRGKMTTSNTLNESSEDTLKRVLEFYEIKNK